MQESPSEASAWLSATSRATFWVFWNACRPSDRTVYPFAHSEAARLAISRYAFLSSWLMEAGTFLMEARKRTVTRKRGRENENDDCAVCLENIKTERTKRNFFVSPFQCSHRICKKCNGKLEERNDNRCPTCRAARKGMTENEAQPAADRNAQPPYDVRDFLNQLLFSDENGLLPRPQTGSIIFFSRVPPISITNQRSTRIQQTENNNERVPTGIISMLLDVPGIPVGEWRRLRSIHRSPSQNRGDFANQRYSGQPQ